MIKATINQNEFDLEVISESEVVLNSENKTLDVISVSSNKKHAIINNVSYSIETVSFDEEKKLATIKVNNKSYQVSLKDKYDLLLKDLGMSNMTTKVIKEIKAPMPGLVVSIQVEKGQEVKAGDSVLILEAMKMENVLKSPIDGVIKTIKTEKSQTVDKNAVLIEFE
ncbi:MAG: biotin/lipoyl-containing protein [Flavobacteriales bacterium]